MLIRGQKPDFKINVNWKAVHEELQWPSQSPGLNLMEKMSRTNN